MSRRAELVGHVSAGNLDRAEALMQQAEVYAATDTFAEGFPAGASYLDAAAELVRAGLLAQPTPGRFTLAASREFVL